MRFFVRRSLITLLPALVGCLADPVEKRSAPAAAPPLTVGVSLQQHPNLPFLSDPTHGAHLARAHDAGFSFDYLILAFGLVQPEPGEPPRRDWALYDRLVADRVELGIEPVVFLWYPPPWAAAMPADVDASCCAREFCDPGADCSCAGLYPPSDPDGEDSPWQRFVREAVDRYREHVRTWFVYHEPDHRLWFQVPADDLAEPCGAADDSPALRERKRETYARLLRATAATIRSVDPGARVGVSLSQPDNLFFLDGVLDEVDVVRFGDYVRQGAGPSGFYSKVDRIAEAARTRGLVGARAPWIELGLGSSASGEVEQADELARRLCFVSTAGAFERAVIFRLLDGVPAATPFLSQQRWLDLGLLRWDGQSTEDKRAYWVVRRAIANLGACDRAPPAGPDRSDVRVRAMATAGAVGLTVFGRDADGASSGVQAPARELRAGAAIDIEPPLPAGATGTVQLRATGPIGGIARAELDGGGTRASAAFGLRPGACADSWLPALEQSPSAHSVLVIHSRADGPADVDISLRSPGGEAVATLRDRIPPLGQIEIDLGDRTRAFPMLSPAGTGWRGSGRVRSASGQPLTVAVHTIAPSWVSSYEAPCAGARALVVPRISRRGPPALPTWADWSRVMIQNVDAGGAAAVTLRWRDRDGVERWRTSERVAPSGSVEVDLRSAGAGEALGADFHGSLALEADRDVAVVVTHSRAAGVGQSVAQPPAGSLELAFPRVARGRSEAGWERFTAAILHNAGDQTAAVRLSFRDLGGRELYAFEDALPAGASRGYNTRFRADVPAPQEALWAALGDAFDGTLVVTSSHPIVGTAQEVAGSDLECYDPIGAAEVAAELVAIDQAHVRSRRPPWLD